MKFLIVLMMLMSTAMAQVNPVTVKTMDKMVTDSVQACSTGKTVKVPVITWGDALVNLHANGSNTKTQPGSLMADRGLEVEFYREDSLVKQVTDYVNCRSPYMRVTLGMAMQASAKTETDPRTKMKVLYAISYSNGGDAMVVKGNIKKPSDLKGKTIFLQGYGPHTTYLARILADAGLTPKDVTIKYTQDLTGTKQSPMAAMQSGAADAVMVITPDALALSSGGSVGTGSEDSVKGAKILLSTKTANRVITDVFVVREDYYQANKQEVFKFVDALYKSEEQVAAAMKNDKAAASKILKVTAKVIFDSEQAVGDAQGLYGDAQFLGFSGNKSFFEDPNFPRGFAKVTQEDQNALMAMGLLNSKQNVAKADWSLADFKKGLLTADKVKAPAFDTTKVATLISKKQKQGNMDSGSLFSFEVYFKPNQDDFPLELYKDAFDKVIALSSTYAGALITVEGHSDPLGYLKQKKANANQMVLSQVRQSAKNLSVTRSNAVREALIKYSKSKGIVLDNSQLAVVGMGIDSPKSGICGGEPCAPKNEQEWLNNMRVEFRIIQVEAEENVFSPL